MDVSLPKTGALAPRFPCRATDGCCVTPARDDLGIARVTIGPEGLMAAVQKYDALQHSLGTPSLLRTLSYNFIIYVC